MRTTGDALYATDLTGDRYRVHDCVWVRIPAKDPVREHGTGKRKRLQIGAPEATARVFLAEDGTQRVYTFTSGDRDATDSALVAQLQRALYAGTTVTGRENVNPR